ncbi:MAG: transglycosylase SLT domain-containing protein [Bdellovibrionales bacterium]|nr:transglycosylase SLT domain-containing protein [Bdellovibrionales bacterium]
MKEIFLTFLTILLLGCAGPTTPFGAISKLIPDSRDEEAKNPTRAPAHDVQELATIEFIPKRQNLHFNKNFQIKIKGVKEKNYQNSLNITYNNINVTKKLLNIAKVTRFGEDVIITVPRLHLPSNRYNDIKVIYNEPGSQPVIATYFPPSCRIYDHNLIENTEPFEPPKYFIHLIETFAPQSHVNPSLIAGIIAQESGFNPNAVSWAKAIGLTQMTPLAEEQIIEDFDHYPRYPNLNDYSYIRIKSLIDSGKLNENEEWRLNPNFSIQGGIAFMKYIDSYWRNPQNAKFWQTLPGDPSVVYSQVLLASYNSGPARVKYAIKRKGSRWLLDKKLTEAHKYVNRVFSYCYHFSYQEPKREYANAF